MGTFSVKDDHGCGFIGGIIRRRKFRPRKPSIHSLPTNTEKKNSVQNGKEKQGNSSIVSPRVSISKNQNQSQSGRISSDLSNNLALVKVNKIQENSIMVSPRVSVSPSRRIYSSSSSSSSNLTPVKVKINQNELVTNYNHNNPQNTGILRVSSGNILKLTQTNVLKNHGNENSPRKSLSKTLECKGTMGNILKRNSYEKIDPEELKSMGNEKYKEGKYVEALELYDQALVLDSNVAVYWSNKSAALSALGRVLEAVVVCKEALRIDPFYCRAHHRLGLLYFRLGYPEEAINHFNNSGSIANFFDKNQAKAMETCLSKCNDAKSRKDWMVLVRHAQNALALGADSALQVYALQAQGLLNLHRHDEAYFAFRQKPSFDMDSYTKLFGQEKSIDVYFVQAQVYAAIGRFEDAITTAQNAVQLDPHNKDLRTILIKTHAISQARSNGNKLFNEQNFSEACNAYNEGLEYIPYNSILLSNRAACRSKLGQFEKALEDSTLALNLQPSYSKARLRRAHCNTKLGRWEAAIQDYEILIREKPGDVEVGRALFEAKIQLKKQCGEDVEDVKFGSDVISVSSIECFRHLITSPGMSVVLFCNKFNQEKALPVLEEVCLRFPSINFLKVEVEDHPYLAKSEEVNYTPAFKIYKNGSRVRDIPGNNLQLLETSVKLYSS